MIISSPNEIAFNLFGFPVYWYGIILAFSVLVGFYFADFLAKYRNINRGFIIDNAVMLILVGLLGARLYYCLLNCPYYCQNPLQILDLRQGGLSIHGMIIAGFFYIVFLSKKHNVNLLSFLDVSTAVLPLSQAIGRWGNFFNNEAFGLPTFSNWGLFVPVIKRPVEYIDFNLFHPTFLYESVLNIFIFIILLFAIRKSKRKGIVFALYLILYSIVRIFVEQIRIDSALNICSIPIAQIISIFLLVIGISILFFKKFDF